MKVKQNWFNESEKMSYLTQWQMQQKALKDAERDRKKNASSFLHKYRGGEHDIKEQKQQKALKDAERDRKKNASSLLHSYRGSEHDVRDQKQQKALKDADRESKKNASFFLHNYKGGEHDIREQTQLKALKDADRENKIIASRLLHKYRGGEHDIKDQKQQKLLKDAERESKKNASLLLHNYKAGDQDIKDHGRAIIEERRESHAREDAGHIASNVSLEINNSPEDGHTNSGGITSSDSPETKIEGAVDTSSAGNIASSDFLETKTVASDNNPGSSKKSLTIPFSFGIIYPDDEPAPTVDECVLAASAIIPHVISQWANESKVFCNPKTPEVFDDIAMDDWYDGEDSIRYKVKGDIMVQFFAGSSATELTEGLRKVLRRHVSFRPISAPEVDKTQMQFVIGEGEQKWMRVREGRLDGLGITF